MNFTDNDNLTPSQRQAWRARYHEEPGATPPPDLDEAQWSTKDKVFALLFALFVTAVIGWLLSCRMVALGGAQ